MISKTFFIFAFFFFCFSTKLSQTKAALGNETDLESLIAIRSKIKRLSSWNQSSHFCKWEGVTCGNRHQRVVSLDLQSQELIGSLSPSIGNLSFLRYVDLSNNSFSGEIPYEIGGLSHLEVFSVSWNSLGGNIPVSLSQCSNLEILRLGLNKFSGSIPSSLGNLSSLRVFDVSSNKLSGLIPDTLGSLSKLRIFRVADNGFTGEIPHLIYNISSLEIISISENHLTGSLPQDLGLTLPNLQQFFAIENLFSGPLPRSLPNASNLVGFAVTGNEFTGDVPNNLGALQSLSLLDLSSNNLGRGESGDLSFINSLTKCSNLFTLSLEINNFGGVLPVSISNLSIRLNELSLGGNPVSGPIPEGIGNLVNLYALRLYSTNLNGTIPSSIGNIHALKELDLSDSEYTGTIPSSLGNISQLLLLGLRGNLLEGSIPSSFGGFQLLQNLDLSQNNLNGSIPKEIFTASLLVLDLFQNYFTGSLPLEVGSLRNLTALVVSANNLSGEVPITLSGCSKMELVDLSYNLFEGAFPQSLKSMRGLRYIDFSYNNFSGQIPKYLEDLPLLEQLILSNNKLEGEVPTKGVFRNASAISVSGNLNLCGGIYKMGLIECPSEGSKKRGDSIALKLAISGASSLVFIALCVILIIYMRRTAEPQNEVSSSISLERQFRLSYRELFQATDGFSPTNFLGSGGTGRVYKGKLEHDENIVAVKVFDLQQKRVSRYFTADCESLSGIHHRNLVKIVTSCSSTDFEGNDFKALVSEFMSNGSLEDWLHPNVHREEGQSRSLNLLQRLNIATDVATALNYLHHECQNTIIHYNLKPTNILLDDDMVAHVGDFSLGKLLWGPMGNMSETRTISMVVKEFVGYHAPEYGTGAAASTLGDTYSYGIVLLELFTGRRPTDEMSLDGLDIHNYARKALLNTVRDIVDPKLTSGEEEIEIIEDCIASLVKIGVACSVQSPGERMDMAEVVKDLHSIRDTFLTKVERRRTIA